MDTTNTQFGLRLAVVFITSFALTFGGCAHSRHLRVDQQSGAEALKSWAPGPVRDSIITFVEDVTRCGSSTYVAPAERIAVFDNDGTLWAEQPMYFQLAFALDRVRELAPQHPEWKTTEPFKSVLDGDVTKALAGGENAVAQIVGATHAGMTSAQFSEIASKWVKTAHHPTTGRLYTQMVYQPMLELLAYLRANEFDIYIVSGGGVEFMRTFANTVYDVLPQNTIGSTIKTEWVMTGDGPEIRRLPAVDYINDKTGKPLAINRVIGLRPIFAFGNSDGDLEMLQWTTAGEGRRFGGIVHHTDAVREWAYDRNSHIGKLDVALNKAPAEGWIVVDMKNDWLTVFPWNGKTHK